MATYDLVILSSSPPASSGPPPSNEQRVRMSAFSPIPASPPERPSTTSSGALKSGSRAAPLPFGATRGFATAGSLVKSHHFDLDLDNEFAETHKAQSLGSTEKDQEAVKKPRKRTTKTAAGDDEAAPKPKKPRPARKTKGDDDKTGLDGGDSVNATNAATKLRIPLEEPPLPPAEPKVKKPRAPRKTTKKDNDAAATTASSYFATDSISDLIPPLPETSAAPTKPKTTKSRKPRAKKAETDENGVLAEKTNITKAKAPAKPRAKAAPKKKTTGAVSTHFTANTNGGDGNGTTQEPQEVRDAGEDSICDFPASPQPKKPVQRMMQPVEPAQPLDLEEAVSRRQDWTPIKDTGLGMPFTDSGGKENEPVAPSNGTFTSMLSTFASAYTDPLPPTTSQAPPPGGAAKMRKRHPSPEKVKAPKKKARTITDHVLDQYAPEDPKANDDAAGMDFFERHTTTTKVPLKDAHDGPSEKPKQRRKRAPSKTAAKGDPKPKKSSAKSTAKPKMIADKLLSPATAISKLNKQDVLFGTSSQLAKDESPTMIRQIQQAIKESENDADFFAYDSNATLRPRIMQRLGKVEGKRQLWAASARDDDGQLLEHRNDVHIPEPDRTQDIPLLIDGTYDEPSSPFADIDDFLPPPTRTTSIATSTSRTASVSQSTVAPVLNVSQTTTSTKSESQQVTKDMRDFSIGDFDDIEDYNVPPPSNQNASSSFLDIDDLLRSTSLAPSTSLPTSFAVPSTTTDTPSGSPTKKPRGRPLKSHSAMAKPSLRHLTPMERVIVQPASTQPPASSPQLAPSRQIAPSTPPKPKPATQSQTQSRFAHIEEILDSEEEMSEVLSPTPPRPSRALAFHRLPLIPSQPALQPSTPHSKSLLASTPSPTKSKADAGPVRVHRIPTSHLQWGTIKPATFAQITSHIKAIQPSANPAHPNWHEQMQMYIPIALEDFTKYLNHEACVRVWKKATKVQIKAWNKHLKGNGEELLDECNVGTEDGEGGKEEYVLAVEKELEMQMVQAWCQEKSVCCVAVEARKGGVRKGLY